MASGGDLHANADGSAGDPLDPSAAPTPRTATYDTAEDLGDSQLSWPRYIGRYAVRGVLGEGGMGVVLEAYDPELDRPVAIKRLRSEGRRHHRRLRLLREAQAMARLSHPNVVQIHDVGVDDNGVFLAMELVRGSNVEQWLANAKRSWREILAPFIAAGRGLAAAHAAGLVHRDFKPSNLLLADDGRVLVADFGVAALADNEQTAADEEPPPLLATPLTQTGAAVGTPCYMAPEQRAGERTSAAADQFSFCVALFEALFNRLPEFAPGQGDLGRALAPSRSAAGDVPPWIVAALRRGLAQDPKDRFGDMDGLLRALQDDPGRRRQRWIRRGATATAAVGLVGVALFAATTRTSLRCSGGATRVAEVWNDIRRDAADAALLAAPAEDRQAIRSGLDDYAQALARADDERCETHHRGEWSSALFDASGRCLERHRAALDEFATMLEAGLPTLRGVREAMVRLPAVATCRDPAQLAGEQEPPPEQRQGIADLQRRIAAAQMRHDAGSIDDALGLFAAIDVDAKALGDGPTMAEAALARGRKALDRMDLAESDSALAQALHHALASDAVSIAAEAAARRVFTRALTAGAPDQTLADAEIAQGLVERAGSPAPLVALLANNVGVVHGHRGDGARAVEHFARALAHADDATNPIDRAGYLGNAALHEPDPLRQDALLTQAGELLEAALGPEHPRTIEAVAQRARYVRDPERALTLLAPQCDALIRDTTPGGSACWCLVALAELHDALDHPDQALAVLERASACVEREREAAPEWSDAELSRLAGHHALLRGDTAAAINALEQARARMAPHRDAPWIATELAEIALLMARAHVKQGRDRDARPLLQTAISGLEAVVGERRGQANQRALDLARRLLADLGRR